MIYIFFDQLHFPNVLAVSSLSWSAACMMGADTRMITFESRTLQLYQPWMDTLTVMLFIAVLQNAEEKIISPFQIQSVSYILHLFLSHTNLGLAKELEIESCSTMRFVFII